MKVDFASIAHAFDLRLIILFGSRAKGTAGPMSDTDVLVASAHTLTPLQEGDLRASLAAALTVPEDTVDLVFLENATPTVLSEALEHGVMLFVSHGRKDCSLLHCYPHHEFD